MFNAQENMALNQPVKASSPGDAAGFPRRLPYLVDGFLPYLMDSSQGEQSIAYVSPIGIGNHPALTIDLETERPAVVAELTRRYARQKTQMRYLIGLATLLGLGVIIIVLVDRIIKQRAIHRTREHIAADLHDELGANLHAIGLLSDLAINAKDSPKKLTKHLQYLRALTERTGVAARYCTNAMESEGLCENLLEDMQRTSSRILADLEHAITFEGQERLQHIKARRRVDLFLFYKECLANVLRHANATQVTTHLEARGELVTLTVADNGQGLGDTKGNSVPESLKRRARLLNAQVSARPSALGGVCITLRLKL